MSQIQLSSMNVSFPVALRAFVRIVREGGSAWAKNFPLALEREAETDLLVAHLNAQHEAAKTSGPFNGPNIPTLSFDDDCRLRYTTCRGTVIELSGRCRCSVPTNWRVTIEGEEASVLRRALASPRSFAWQGGWETTREAMERRLVQLRREAEEEMTAEASRLAESNEVDGLKCVPPISG